MLRECEVCGELMNDRKNHVHSFELKATPVKGSVRIFGDGEYCGRCGVRLLNDYGSVFCINCGHAED